MTDKPTLQRDFDFGSDNGWDSTLVIGATEAQFALLHEAFPELDSLWTCKTLEEETALFADDLPKEGEPLQVMCFAWFEQLHPAYRVYELKVRWFEPEFAEQLEKMAVIAKAVRRIESTSRGTPDAFEGVEFCHTGSVD